MIRIKSLLNDIYLDYLNNYITLEKMAEHQGMNVADLRVLIDLGRKISKKEYNKED